MMEEIYSKNKTNAEIKDRAKNLEKYFTMTNLL